jgi:folate-binding protein YgfZ
METVAANLKMYKIGRDVEIAQVAGRDRTMLSVIGPKARELAGISPPPEENAFVEGELVGAKLLAVATDRGIDLIFDSSEALPAVDTLGIDRVSPEAAEIVRIERGRPRFGLDMSDENLPGELGLEERAVSFTKGCYVGQEPVARMHHRGHPNRHLRGLELSQPADRGEPVAASGGEADGKLAGTITSAAVSPTFGPIALSVLRREIEPGAQVVAGVAPARVVALPFEAG